VWPGLLTGRGGVYLAPRDELGRMAR
jgi:hypothetical protein